MNIVATIQKMLAPMHRRIMLMVSRAIITVIDDAAKMQRVQVKLLDGEVAELERVQNYGFTSSPPEKSEGVAVFVGGNRDHGVVICVDNREYRLKVPEKGSVAMYDKAGNKIVLTPSSGKIEINAKTTVNVLAAGKINLGSETLTALDGVVTGQCQCAYGVPKHPVASGKVRSSLA